MGSEELYAGAGVVVPWAIGRGSAAVAEAAIRSTHSELMAFVLLVSVGQGWGRLKWDRRTVGPLARSFPCLAPRPQDAG